jgi:hypothetical protein
MRRFKRSLRTRIILALLIVPFAINSMGGCADDICKTFTTNAAAGLQLGVTSILTGLVNGFFAVAFPSAKTNTTNTTQYTQGLDANTV